jgi:general secretion pathway protein G
VTPGAGDRPGLLRGSASFGITYVELMIALGVMAVLATLALPTGMRVHRRAQEAELKRALHAIRSAIDEYHQDWELGYIESDSDHGWPETLETLTEEVEYWGPLPGQDAGSTGSTGGTADPFANRNRSLTDSQGSEPFPKVYLRRIPKDPFNSYDDEWDGSGWRALSYDDEPDSSSWGGDGVYDVYSGSDWPALDGLSRYPEW